MKKITCLLLLMALIAAIAFGAMGRPGDTYNRVGTIGDAGIIYVSTQNTTFVLPANVKITTTNAYVRENGTGYQLKGVMVAASSNIALVALGTGSSTTSSWTPVYDAVIPMEKLSTTTDGPGGTENFKLDINTIWFEQFLTSGKTDDRGRTVNIEIRKTYNSAMNTANSTADSRQTLDTLWMIWDRNPVFTK